MNRVKSCHGLSFFVTTWVIESSNIWLGNRGKCLNLKQITQWWKDVFNLSVILIVAGIGMSLLQNYIWLSSGKCLFILSTRNWNNGQQKSHVRVSHELSIYLRHLHQDQNLPITSLSRRYQQFCLPTIWRHATKKIEVHPRSIISALHYALKEDGNFTSKRIKPYSGVSSLQDRIVQGVLNNYGYHYWQARRKRLLTGNDLKLCMKFAKDKQKYYDDGLWLSGILFI